jgi:hypothetical protein
MRSGYSVSKILAFLGLAVAEALAGYPEATALGGAAAPILGIARIVAWIAVVVCVLRGLPVVTGAIRRNWHTSPPAGGSTPA